MSLSGRNTLVQHSQHLTQADPRVFGQSYVANCSSVDGQAASRDEESDERHIEYFQGLEQFHEDGLPDKLPANLEGRILIFVNLRLRSKGSGESTATTNHIVPPSAA